MQQVLTQSQPFGLRQHIEMPLGMSVADICQRAFGTMSGVVAFIRCPEGAKQLWEVIPADMWARVKPTGKNCLKFEFYPAGGKGSNIFATIAAVLVSVAAPYLAGTVLGLTGNALLIGQAAIAIGGNLLVAKLFPAQQPGAPKAIADQAEAAFTDVDSDSNVLGKGMAPPRIIGQRRVALPDACQPHRYLSGGQEIIDRVLVATGFHSITDLKADKVSFDNIEGITYQIRDGSEDAAQQTLIKKVTKTNSVGQEFSKFQFKQGVLDLVDQVTPANSEPKEIIVAPGYHADMDQITIRLGLEPFLYQTDSGTIRLPIRIKMWEKATPATIYYLPEIHIIGKTSSRIPKEIKLRWDDNFGFVAASSDFSFAFYREVPATSRTLSDGSSGTQWEANDQFKTGTGYQDTKNITGSLDSVNIRLDSDIIPKGDYEISVTVGLPVRSSTFTESTYLLSGTVESLFISRLNSGIWSLPITVDGVFAGGTLEFTTLVVNRKPVEAPGFAQIAMRFAGVSAKNITCLAGAYVNDWGGSAWDNEIVTKNPAPHFRHVLRDAQAFSRVSTTLNNDTEFLAWRTECASKGYEVNFVAAGQSINEILGHIATAGFATKRFGNGYGVGYHRDRSGDTPEMTFSHRDSKISVERVFADNPKGYRADFDNEELDWSDDEIIVNNPYGSTTLSENEGRSFPSISNPALVERRVMFDALNDAYRNKIWKISTGPAGFNRKRDDLIGIVTDLDTDYAHGFFVRQVLDARTIAVDRAVPAGDYDPITDSTDLLAETDLMAGGVVSSAHILMPTGLEEYTIANVTDNIIRLTTDLSDTDIQGTRMTVAARANLFRRCIVLDVKRQSEQKAVVYAVEEQPIIEAELTRLYG